MSVNDSGAECSQCGSYNCEYLCTECVLELLLEVGIPKDKALTALENKGIELEEWQIKEVEKNNENHINRSTN